MRFPKIDDVAAELRDINKYDLEPEDADEGIDVRLQVYPDGQWAVRWGLSDYDQDHRGYWGASSVPGNNRRFNSKDIARDLIDQAKDAFAEGAGFEEAPAQPRVRSRRQPSLPGFPDIPEKIDIEIPDMPMWEQIGGDMDPAKYGGTIARSDGDALELLQIQPVREYVGGREAAEIGHPFWTREAWFDLDDLDPKSKDVQSALGSIGMSLDTLEDDFTPTQRAVVIAEALLGYGRGDEGPAGWSSDIYADSEVRWQDGRVETIEDRLAEEDEEFRDEVLGWGEIKEKLEETSNRMIDESAAQGSSQLDDQTMIDLEKEGFDDQSAFNIAEFGDAIAVNTDLLIHPDFAREIGIESDEKVLIWSDVGTREFEAWLEKNGYEVTDRGGQAPGVEGYAYTPHLIQAVARETGQSEETVEEAAKTLDWWPTGKDEEIYGTSDGFVTLWAKPVEREEDVEAPRRRAPARRSTPRRRR